jgi:TetR/AcrR family transcriptional repressor of nem operon
MNQRKKQPAQTRQAILDAADADFSLHGYCATGIGGIVVRAELTKGGLFHHFPDKRALAVAWISERLGAGMDADWIAPLEGAASLDALRDLCRLRCKELRPNDSTSALVAVAAETAAGDESLADALEGVFSAWRAALAGFFERGKAAGWIYPAIHPEAEAMMFVSAFAGFTVSVKTSRNPQARQVFLTAFEGYLETLRAQQG